MIKNICIAIFALFYTHSVAAESVNKAESKCLAVAIKHEAQGESKRGQIAVGYVVLNRIHSGAYPTTICKTIHQGRQFSFSRTLKTTEPYFISLASEIITSYDSTNDPSKGALFFHNKHAHPHWNTKTTITIGGHIFSK